MRTLFRKYKLYRVYKNLLRKESDFLKRDYAIKIDYVNRFYSVLNIPPELVEEPYNIRKADIDIIAERYIKEYIKLISEHLNAKGMNELFSLYEIKKVGKMNYLIVFGYSQFNTAKIARNIYFRILPAIGILGLLYWLLNVIF